MNKAIQIIQGELIGMVTEIVTTLVSSILQQQSRLHQSILKSETMSRKRMGKDYSDDNMSRESNEKEYSEEMKDSNSSGDEGTQINTTYQSNRKNKAHKVKSHKGPCLDKTKAKND